MEERLKARIDTTHRRTEALLMQAIKGDIQAAIDRGQTPLPISSLSPRRGHDADQGVGASCTTQGVGPSGTSQDPLV
ncbi:hypothetical protein Hanom_Chr03g00196861 [Helianthus anomalus]